MKNQEKPRPGARRNSGAKIGKSCAKICPLLKTLSHPQRMIILGHLVGAEKSVSDLVEACRISQSQMSQFLLRMKSERLVKTRREGSFQIYSLADSRLEKLLRSIQEIYCS